MDRFKAVTMFFEELDYGWKGLGRCALGRGVVHQYDNFFLISYLRLYICQGRFWRILAAAGIPVCDIPVNKRIAAFGSLRFDGTHHRMLVIVERCVLVGLADGIGAAAWVPKDSRLDSCCLFDQLIAFFQIGEKGGEIFINRAIVVGVCVSSYDMPLGNRPFQNRFVSRHAFPYDEKGRLDVMGLEDVQHLSCNRRRTVIKCQIRHFFLRLTAARLSWRLVG